MPSLTTRRNGTKNHSLCFEIRKIAASLGPSAKLPTVQQLCTSLQTSKATLDGALDDLEAQDVIIRKNGVGIFVSPTLHHKSIAILFDASLLRTMGETPFWGVLWGLFAEHTQFRAEEKDERYTFHIVPETQPGELPVPAAVAGMADSERLDGVITVGLNKHATDWIGEREIPFVAYAGPGHFMVRVDFDQMIELGVKALEDAGCRTIGFFYPLDATHDLLFDLGLVGHFKATLERHAVPVIDRWVIVPAHDTAHLMSLNKQEQGMRIAWELFNDAERPDGVLIADDMMTAGFLAGLRKQGREPNRDIRIASHTNAGSTVLFSYEDEVTLIEVDPEEIVRAAFRQLDDLMAGRKPRHDQLMVPPKLRIAERAEGMV